jgi:hypothetical protein
MMALWMWDDEWDFPDDRWHSLVQTSDEIWLDGRLIEIRRQSIKEAD